MGEVATRSKRREPGRFVTLKSGRVIFIPKGYKKKWADVRDKVLAGKKGGEAQFHRDPGGDKVAEWKRQIEKWGGLRTGVGYNAVYDIGRLGSQAIVIEEAGELKGITSVTVPREVGGLFGPRIEGDVVVGMYMASKESGKGYGLRMFRKMAQIAADGGWSLRTNPTEAARPFLKKIGAPLTKHGGVDMDPKEVRAWLGGIE